VRRGGIYGLGSKYKEMVSAYFFKS